MLGGWEFCLTDEQCFVKSKRAQKSPRPVRRQPPRRSGCPSLRSAIRAVARQRGGHGERQRQQHPERDMKKFSDVFHGLTFVFLARAPGRVHWFVRLRERSVIAPPHDV